MIYIFLGYHKYFAWCPCLWSFWLQFSCCSVSDSLGVTFGGIPCYIFFSVSIGVSLVSLLGCLPGFRVCVFTLGFGAWFCCCFPGYLCITCSRAFYGSFYTPHQIPLCLLVHCCYATLGMTLNNSSRFLSVVWFVSFIGAKGAFGVGYFNASTESRSSDVAVLADDTIGIFTYCGKIHIIINYFRYRFCQKHFVASIVFQCQTNVPSG